jgi:pyruvate/2-oxoglutarate dehydrogenase complex dihydrolipoamide dehydrogenase (E3) component
MMRVYDYDIGIIGGGSAGLTIAAGASQFGAKTLLIEKEALGGDCLHYGCVPSKTLIKSAKVYHQMKHAERYGLPPVDVPPVEFRALAERIRSVIGVIQQHDSAERFCSLGALVEFGAPEFIDEHAVRVNGKIVSAKSWVIATGSSPAIPRVEGLAETRFVTNRELFYLDRLPESMVVLGAGPISIEMAQTFNRLGTRVFVVQRSSQILTREDRDMADVLMDRLAAEGVIFHLNSSTLKVQEHGNSREVVIKTGEGNTQSLMVDTVLVALGREANLSGLGLESLGIEFDKNGLALDNRLRTKHPHIYGAGDVTGTYQFTHAAGYEGGVVLTNAVLRLPRKVDYTFMPWCTYTDPELASIGMNEKRAKETGISYSVWTEEFRMNDRALAEGDAIGKVKLLLDEKEKPIGVQILGMHAGDLLSEWVAVMTGGVKLTALAGAVHPYPTLAEANKRVVGTFLSGKIFSEKVKKALKFFFQLRGRACFLQG